MVFLYIALEGKHMGNFTFQIDSQNIDLKKGECAKKAIAAGDHQLSTKLSGKLAFQNIFHAESGENYYFETNMLGGIIISQVSAEAASAWAQKCKQLP